MKPYAVVLFLALIPMTVLAEEEGLKKGEKVFISASFKKIDGPSPVAGVKLQYDIPTCAEFTVIKTSPEKSTWVVKDAMNGKLHLGGAWIPRLHRDKAACEAYLSEAGEPTVERSGRKFTMVPRGSK